MLVRISPQWQITIPTALRVRFGQATQAEIHLEDGVLMVRPAVAPSADWVESQYAPQGITKEVLWEAMRVIEGRRRRKAER